MLSATTVQRDTAGQLEPNGAPLSRLKSLAYHFSSDPRSLACVLLYLAVYSTGVRTRDPSFTSQHVLFRTPPALDA